MPDDINLNESGNTTNGGITPQPTTPAPASTTPAQPTNNAAADDDLPDFVRDPKKAFEYIKDLRKEAAEHRKLANELKSWKDKQEADAKIQAEEQLRSNQQFEALASQYKAELEKVQAEAKAAQIQALRTRIGAEMSLPAALIERLRGDTDEDIRKDAESLKAALPIPEPQSDGTSRPRPSTTPMPTGAAGETDAQKKARLLNRGNTSVFGSGVIRISEG